MKPKTIDMKAGEPHEIGEGLSTPQKDIIRLTSILKKYFKSDIFIGIQINRIKKEGEYKPITVFECLVLADKENLKILFFLQSEPGLLLGIDKKTESITGKARGINYTAYYREEKPSNSYYIILDKDDLSVLLSPKKIPKILDKAREKYQRYKGQLNAGSLQRVEEPEGLFWTGFSPMKSMAMISTIDQNESIKNWEKRNNRGLEENKNPILEGGLKGSQVSVYFTNKQGGATWEQIAYPKNSKELQGYLQTAWGPEAYVTMLMLSKLSHDSGRQTFTVNMQELCKAMYGNYSSSTREKVAKAIVSLHYSEILLTRPDAVRKGTHNFIFNPLKVEYFFQNEGAKTPNNFTVKLWPQSEGPKFGRLAIPDSIFTNGLRQNDFSLACYLLLEMKHGRKDKNTVKISIINAIKAAGIYRTYLSKKHRAIDRLKDKLNKMVLAGLIDNYQEKPGGYIEINKEAYTRAINATKSTGVPKRIKPPD
jgi:hypothetical protein